MAVTFDNPTHINGLVIVAFKGDGNETMTLDASTYMNEVYTVVVNPISISTAVVSSFDSGDNPFPLSVPIFAEWTGTTITLKQADEQAGTSTTTIAGEVTGVIIGRK